MNPEGFSDCILKNFSQIQMGFPYTDTETWNTVNFPFLVCPKALASMPLPPRMKFSTSEKLLKYRNDSCQGTD